MRWSTYVGEHGVERAAVWEGQGLHPVPEQVGVVGLLGDDGTRLRAAAERAPGAAGRPGGGSAAAPGTPTAVGA